jgi:hypothetical protein
MPRGRLLAILVAVASVSTIWMLLPRRARELSLAPDPRLVRGAIHIHTTRSDGAGTPDDVARAARRAGLDFVILTDHGDALRAPDPPRYVEGVLVIDAVEISTADGHYIALGIGQAPYRLAGDARDVIDDVHRLGGFGFAAHPESRKPDLRWREWDVPLDGIEWLNADSEWRDETRSALARTFLTYWIRGPESLARTFSRPVATHARWDRLTPASRVVAVAAADAHARLPREAGAEPGDGPSLRVPSYENSFRAMATRVLLTAPLTRTDVAASADATALLTALRAGHAFTAIDAIAGPARLDFHADAADGRAEMGDELVTAGRVELTVELSPAVPDATVVLLKNGLETGRISASSRMRERYEAGEAPAVFRVEVRLPGAPGEPPVPWIVGNPIYLRHEPRVPPTSALPTEVVRTLTDGQGSRAWTIERHPVSEAKLQPGMSPGGEMAEHFTWRLAGGVPSGQYAALALPVSGADFVDADRLRVTLQAPRPMRISIQVRVPDGGGLRWQRSVYVDATPRALEVPFSEMHAIEGGRDARLELSRVNTLLLVVDTVNAVPGSAGECWVGPVSVLRRMPTSAR